MRGRHFTKITSTHLHVFQSDSKSYCDCVISHRNDVQVNFTFILTLPIICLAGDDVAFAWLSKSIIDQSEFQDGVTTLCTELYLSSISSTKNYVSFLSNQQVSFELCRNKRTEPRFRGIIFILLCFEPYKMLIIPLNLDSVLLFLHNSKLAYWEICFQDFSQ